LHADELPFLCRVCINDAITGGIVEDNREIRVGKIGLARNFYLNAQITAREGGIEWAAGRMERLKGN